MGKWSSSSKYLCSVYPGKLQSIVRAYGPDPSPRGARRSTFEFKPVDRFAKSLKERYSVIEIVDCWENVPNPTKPIQTFMGRMPFDASPVPCEDIVRDLMNIWCGSTPGLPAGVAPGVMEIANSVPTGDELKELERRQAVFCEFQVQEGERLYREKNLKAITPAMRESAKWLGQTREWMDLTRSSKLAPCPLCFQLVNEAQSICHHCQKQIKAMPADIAALQKAEPVVAVV
jgi:hypothetical protein